MFKNFCSTYCKVLALLFLSSSFVYSQGIPDALRLGESGLGANARALGMGDAYIGLSDDASAAFYNPAGFGLLKRLELSGGIDYSTFSNDATFFNNTTNYSSSETRLDRLSFAFPFPTVRGSLVFGISYHNTKDLTGALKFNGFNSGNNSLIQVLNQDTYYDNNGNPYNIPYDLRLTDTNLVTPIDGNLNQSGTILNTGSTNNWTFSGAIEAAQNLYLGLNLNIISGSYNSNNDYYEDDSRNMYQGPIYTGDNPPPADFQTFYLNRILNWDISGWSAKAGLIYQFNDYGRFGLTVQFPRYYTVKEKFTVSGQSYFANYINPFDLPQDYNSSVKYDIVSPYEFGAGFSVNLKGFIISAQGTAIDYSQLKFDNPQNYSNPNDLLSVNKNINDQLRAVLNYNVGVEYTVPTVGLRLRTGYFVQPSAYKGDPSSFNRKYFTAGIGILAQETLGLDLAWAHGWWSTIGDNYGTDVSRTYQDIKYDKIMLTATYRF
ncbi:MAG: hypothetical protein WCE54_01265 [Ignavibacteriaceae bacterium]